MDKKEHIREVTTALIEENDGDIEKVTARMIAERAGVGLGLINYHFGSKENLITECVQRIIGKVVANFRGEPSFSTDRERLTAWATEVFHFLFAHPAICRISILGDFQHYTGECNSVCTQKGFLYALKGEHDEKALRVFALTAAMQAAFLGGETAGHLLGYDFSRAEDRGAYIQKTMKLLFPGEE